MDISSLYNISSGAVKSAANDSVSLAETMAPKVGSGTENIFSSVFQSAVDNLNTTNAYLSDSENEKMRLALGETDSTHDLIISLQKASTALQYTVAVRDKFIEAYKEIMQMQM